MQNRTWFGALGLLVASCTGAGAPSGTPPLEQSEPLAIVWLSPDATAIVRTDAPVDLAVSTQNPGATVVHFALDGTEIAACDPTAPGEDCHRGSLWQWTTRVPTAGHHTLVASFTSASGVVVQATRAFDAVDGATVASVPTPASAASTEADPVAPESLDLEGDGTIDDPNAPPATEPDAPVVMDDESAMDPAYVAGIEDDGTVDPSVAPAPPVGQLTDYLVNRGYLDPSSAFHSFAPGGLAWQVVGQRVVLQGAVLEGDVVDPGSCVATYGDSIAHYADQYYVSRAALVAAAVASTGCHDGGNNWGPTGIRRSTCAALTANDPQPLDPIACGQRMRAAPDFAWLIAARWIASAQLLAQHHNDPPLVAATYATGGLYPSLANRWHLAAPLDATGTHDFITTFVATYNAYRTMETANAEADRDHSIDQGSPIFSYQNPMMDDGPASQSTIDTQSAVDDPATYASTNSGTSAVIHYHGGPVMSGSSINVYLIWYGARWNSHPRSRRILRNFITNESDSAYWHINLTYPDGHSNYPSRVLHVAGEVHVGIPGHRSHYTFSGQGIADTISRQIHGHALPSDPHGIYLIMAADNVTNAGLCTKFCAWHSYFTVGSATYISGFIGNANRCMNSCSAQRTSPNGDAVADAIASYTAHEISEAATDPLINAWFDAHGQEDDDKCAWNFGHYATLSNGARTNITLHGQHYYIQRNWVNRGAGYCAMRVE